MGNIHIVSTLQNKVGQKTSVFQTSSAVFFGIVNKSTGIDTEISFLNHFLLKRSISDVSVTTELRDLNGELLEKFKLLIDKHKTYSIKLSNHLKKNFIGSVYLFFNSNENLAVPFCAVMSTISTKNSVCGVHTYGRRLEKKELGTSIDLPETVETGWTLRDSEKIKSFAVLHGGEFELRLNLRLECANKFGTTKSASFSHNLQPFGTLLITPQDYIASLIDHLKGEKGHAKVFISGLSGIFPRMLCGNFVTKESKNSELSFAREIQFTHTNFDFSSVFQPDAGGNIGYYNQPALPKGYGIIYPIKTKKSININGKNYLSSSIHHINIESMNQIEVIAQDENLPSRFVSAAVGIWDKCTLESECSTGIFIEDYLKVPCHWHWGLLKPGIEDGDSVISIILNKFNRNENLNRIVKLRVFSEEQIILDKDMAVSDNMKIDAMDILPQQLPTGSLWYVFSGDCLEDLNIYSTFYPKKKSGFVEHCF